VAFLPDLSYSLFYLISLYFFLRYLTADKGGALAVALVAFVLSLFCKEAAATLPAVLLIITFLCALDEEHKPWRDILRAARFAIVKTFPFLFLEAVYLVFHWVVKAGQIYPASSNHPHYMEFSLSGLRLKYKYLKWAFNLPDGLIFEFQGWTNYLIAAGVLIFAVPFAFSLVRNLCQLQRLSWCGTLWFVATLAPVLFLPNLTMHHNLYIPLVGLGLLMGAWVDETRAYFELVKNVFYRFLIPAFVLSYGAAVYFHNQHAARDSWIAEASRIAERSLRDLKLIRPRLEEGTILYIVDRSLVRRGDPQWFYDYGSLFRLFYPVKSLEVRFIGRRDKLPDQRLLPDKALVLEFNGFGLWEVPREKNRTGDRSRKSKVR